MAGNVGDPFGLGALNALFETVVDQVQDGLAEGLDALHDLLDAADGDDFDVANDAVILLLGAAEAADDVADDLTGEIIGAWTETFGHGVEALSDLVRRLFEQFAAIPDLFRRVLDALLAGIEDFATFFRDLCQHVIGAAADFRDAVGTVLLPVFAAGGALFGAGAAAAAIWLVLGSDAPVLSTRATALDLGLPAPGLPAWTETALRSPAFTLPKRVWLVAALLEALRQAGGFAETAGAAPTGNGFLDLALGPLVAHFGAITTEYIADAAAFAEALVEKLILGAENDARLEWLLLQVARFTPVGLFLLVVATGVKLLTSPAPWLSLLFNPIEDDPNLAVLRLPRPTATRKYVIFSDVHRDERDAARPPFQFGSIDHFLSNRTTYLELLRHHADAGYVILEAGDCEELWFHRDFSLTPGEKLAEIIATNSEIYGLQRELHAEGRYFRIFGNHDSYVRDPEVFEVLRRAMESDGSPPFRIFDFLVIEGVKTMHDVPVFLGLDSEPNAERKPLLVTHGHQWDFWNCDANNILGKIIVSAVVTPLDMLDDPLRDIAGIASFGTPLVNFKQILGELPVFSSWQSYEPAVVRLDRIQHMEDTDRFFVDDIQYSESLAALMGLMIPVAAGPGDSCALDLGSGCLLNLMSIGHTHNPQNMPYFDLGDLPVAKDVADSIEVAISAATQGLLNPQVGLVRSNYINSGVCGWYDESFWAVDLGDQSHGTGQPKLVNWTYNTRPDRPNQMDWELPHLPRDGGPTPGDLLDARLRELIAAGLGMLEGQVARGRDALASLPVGALFADAARGWSPTDLDIDLAVPGRARDRLLLQIALALLPGRRGGFEVRLRLPKTLRAELARLSRRPLPGAGRSARRQLIAAIATLAVTRGVAVAGLRGGLGGPEGEALGLMLLLAQLAEARTDRLSAQIALRDGDLVCSLAFGAAAPGPRPRAIVKREAAEARGLRVRAYLKGAGTPLSGWNVRLERAAGRSAQVLTSARTDARGEATLLGVTAERGRIRIGTRETDRPEIALYPPASGARRPKAAVRSPLDPASGATRLSLPVTFAELVASGFYGGSKLRSPSQKLAEECGRWHKRLADKRDPHAKADLCLQDLILATIGAIHDPKTPFEKAAAKAAKSRLGDTSAFEKVAEHARKARRSLKECLGEGYVECDGRGPVKDLGRRILIGDARFESLAKFFGNPTPDPLSELLSPKPGLGFPSMGFSLDKICLDRMDNGLLPPDLAAEMQAILEGGILAPPSVNQLHVWDPVLGAGQIARIAEVEAKRVTLRTLGVAEGTATLDERVLDMDVELDDPTCLVLEPDATNRQALIVDVQPGQTVVLFGSGFVSATARVSASFRPWAAGTDEGRLVPTGAVLPAAGFDDLVVPVFGERLPIGLTDTPESYNGDTVGFRWPEAAAQPGLYRLRVTFRNESARPTGVVQQTDCSLDVDRGEVVTRDLLFAVLPAPQSPAIRITASDVGCLNLTDPEGFLGIPWPDDLYLAGTGSRLRITIPDDGSDPFGELLGTLFEDDGFLMFWPGTWSPDLKLFPEETGFAQLGLLESATAQYVLFEVEGVYDKVVIGTLLGLAVIVATLLAAAVVVALFVILVFVILDPTQISKAVAGALAAALAAALAFVFGPMFGALSSAVAAIVAATDGQDVIGQGTIGVDGHKLLFELAEARFHRVLAAGTDLSDAPPSVASLGQTFENSALGGEYEVTLAIDEAD